MNGSAVTSKAPAAAAAAVEGRDGGALRRQEPLLCGSPVLREASLEAQRRVEEFLAEEAETPLLRAVQEQVRTSLAVVDQALEQYGTPQLSISYNGGKDCLVLLYLILARLPSHFSTTTTTTKGSTTTAQNSASPSDAPAPVSNNNAAVQRQPFPDALQAVYVVSNNPFAEVNAFVKASGADYGLAIEPIRLPMKAALQAYLDARPQVRAIFVGTRRTDPHGQDLTHFDQTDAGWPDFMRIHPVVDWHYAEIWAFIRHLNIPYCELYDRGYTSLGGTTDTSPNPALKRGDGGEASFRPAYELMEDLEERLGRNR